MKKSIWIKGKRQYFASYVRTKKDRVFELAPIKGGKIYSFESWQMAVKHGFNKVRKV